MHNVLIILARLVIQFENWKYKNFLMLISILETTCHIPMLRYTPMSYAAPQWATPHPNELKRVMPHINELRHNTKSYDTHPNEIRHTPMSYATLK